jgi:phytoene/squalene synthetase
MDYCRYSAMPVGRFVLDVHNESPALWSASDALCAALQLINHLQDCGKDYRHLNRVYLPLDMLASEGCDIEALGGPAAPPELLRTVRRLGRTVQDLLERARPFAAGIKDARLGYEVAVIQKLAEDLTQTLMRRDPLSQRVHHHPAEAAALAVLGAAGGFLQRRRGRR